MRQYFYLLFAICIFPFINSFAQGSWQQKANFGGGNRWYGTGFSIGTKGYIGTGWNSSFNNTKDFWEYDRLTNVWTQKANFGGIARNQAVGFSIGTKGYIGTGNVAANNELQDFWEWDQATNTWTQKANVPGNARAYAVGFSIGSKGYIGGGGYGNVTILTDFWEWDQASNTWTQKANIPGAKKINIVGFSIANKGYVGTGMDSTQNIFYDDFWEWDQVTNTWAQKANFPGGKRWGAYAYSIGNYGYLGMGDSLPPFQTGATINDLWRYFPFTNTWSQVLTFPVGARTGPVGFSIGCQGFFGTGADTNYVAQKDFWEYYPDTITAAVSGISSICSGDSTSLYAFGGIYFSWSTGDTTPFITVNPSVTTTYTVVVSDVCGSATTTATVNVFKNPVASVMYQPDLCGGNFIQFTDSSSNATSWNWNFGDGNSSSMQNPVHTYSAAGTYSVTLFVTNSSICLDTMNTIVDVPPFSQLYIPNSFTPNGDNNNDVYYIYGKCITDMTFSIYNRWGEKVFETTDPAKGWDGVFKGEKENSGVFIYSFDGTLTTGEKINKKGNITLLR